MQAYAEFEPFGSIEHDYQRARLEYTQVVMAGGKVEKRAPKIADFMRPEILTSAEEKNISDAMERYNQILEEKRRRALENDGNSDVSG